MNESSPRAAVDHVACALDAHRTALHRTAARILRCHDAALDAVQEALIALWLDPPAHDQERAWLVRTVVHRSLHHRRSRQRRQYWESEAVRAAQENCPGENPLRELEHRQIASILERALRALPEPYQATFSMREIEGWNYERIAVELGVPVGTVRSRLNRARAALRSFVTVALADAE